MLIVIFAQHSPPQIRIAHHDRFPTPGFHKPAFSPRDCPDVGFQSLATGQSRLRHPCEIVE
jgi:hypothetical protein